jgi:hypothetical protein
LAATVLISAPASADPAYIYGFQKVVPGAVDGAQPQAERDLRRGEGEHTRRRAERRGIVRRLPAHTHVERPGFSVQRVTFQVEPARLDSSIADVEQVAALAGRSRHVRRLRLGTKERGTRHGGRAIHTPQVDAAPAVRRRANEVQEVDAVREEHGPSMGDLALLEIEQSGRLHVPAVGRHL